MVIVHIITRLINGGADINTVLNCNYQAEAGHIVYLITGRDYEPEILEKLSNKVTRLTLTSLVRPISPINDLMSMVMIYVCLRSLGAEIVHTHTSKAGFVGRIAALFYAKAKVIHTFHINQFSQLKLRSPIEFIIEYLLMRRTDRAISVSSEVVRKYRLLKIFQKKQTVHLIRSGIEIEKFLFNAAAYKKSEFRQENASKIIVLLLAALEIRKGHQELLRVIRANHNENIQFIFAGQGPTFTDIEAYIKTYNIPNVSMLGHIQNPESVINIADVILSCSSAEGLSQSLVQGHINDCYVMALATSGASEILHGVDDGKIYSNLENMYSEIASLRPRNKKRKNPDTYSDWSVEKMVTETLDLYAN
jgi:glycosyltransferase involved in cell wall biosynthesis